MRRTSPFFAHLCTREQNKLDSVFASLLSLLRPLIQLCKSKHDERKVDLMAIRQFGILTLQPGVCSTRLSAIACGVGHRQDRCVFHVLSKKEQRP